MEGKRRKEKKSLTRERRRLKGEGRKKKRAAEIRRREASWNHRFMQNLIFHLSFYVFLAQISLFFFLVWPFRIQNQCSGPSAIILPYRIVAQSAPRASFAPCNPRELRSFYGQTMAKSHSGWSERGLVGVMLRPQQK